MKLGMKQESDTQKLTPTMTRSEMKRMRRTACQRSCIAALKRNIQHDMKFFSVFLRALDCNYSNRFLHGQKSDSRLPSYVRPAVGTTPASTCGHPDRAPEFLRQWPINRAKCNLLAAPPLVFRLGATGGALRRQASLELRAQVLKTSTLDSSQYRSAGLLPLVIVGL